MLTDPAPVVQIAHLGDSAVKIAAKPWVAVGDYGAIETDLNLALVEAMRRHGIQMPFPQYEVHLHGTSELPQAAKH